MPCIIGPCKLLLTVIFNSDFSYLSGTLKSFKTCRLAEWVRGGDWYHYNVHMLTTQVMYVSTWENVETLHFFTCSFLSNVVLKPSSRCFNFYWKISFFCCHEHSSEIDPGSPQKYQVVSCLQMLKCRNASANTSSVFHNQKCGNTVLHCGHWLGALLT